MCNKMNIYYTYPQFNKLPNELKNHICSYLCKHPIVKEMKIFLDNCKEHNLPISILLISNKKFKQYVKESINDYTIKIRKFIFSNECLINKCKLYNMDEKPKYIENITFNLEKLVYYLHKNNIDLLNNNTKYDKFLNTYSNDKKIKK